MEEVGSGWMILMKRFIYGLYLLYEPSESFGNRESLLLLSPTREYEFSLNLLLLGNNDNTICVSTSYIRTGQTKLN